MISQSDITWIASSPDDDRQFRSTTWNGIEMRIMPTGKGRCTVSVKDGKNIKVAVNVLPCEAVRLAFKQAEQMHKQNTTSQAEKIATMEAVDQCIGKPKRPTAHDSPASTEKLSNVV